MTTKKKLTLIFAMGMLLINIFYSCSPKKQAERTSNKTSEQITIGVTTTTLRHQFFIAMDEGMKEAAKEKNINLLVNDPNLDPQRQIAAIEDFAQQGVQGLIVVGTDASAIVPAVEDAAKTLPVVTIDMKLNTNAVDSYIGTVNNEAGAQLGKYTARYVKNELNGKAQIAVVAWLESSIQRQRIEGFLTAFEDMENVTILNTQPGYDREESMNTVENVLQANPDINIIYATAENSVLGSLAAIESANRDDVKIVGFDLTKEAAGSIQSGEIIAMIQQQPKEMGRQAVFAVLDAIEDKKVDKNIPIPVLLYDATNVGEFLNQ